MLPFGEGGLRDTRRAGEIKSEKKKACREKKVNDSEPGPGGKDTVSREKEGL